MVVELTGMKRWLAFSGLETSQAPNTRPTGGYQLSPRGSYRLPHQLRLVGKGFRQDSILPQNTLNQRVCVSLAEGSALVLFGQEGVEEGVSHEGVVSSPAYDALLVDDNRGGQAADPVGVPAASSLI